MSKMMLKGYTDDMCVMFPFDAIIFMYNEQNTYIDGFSVPSGDRVDVLLSNNGSKVYIEDLKCKEYDELVVQLDLHDLWFEASDVYVDDVKEKSNHEKDAIIRKLRLENKKLKQKLEGLKKFLDKE